MIDTILNFDALEGLKMLSDRSVDCVITSPPYWGLRDYGTLKWEGGDNNCTHSSVKLKSRYDYSLDKSKIQFDSVGTDASRHKNICPDCGAVKIDNQVGLEDTPNEYIERLLLIFTEIKRVLKDEGTCWVNLGDTYSSGKRAKNGETWIETKNPNKNKPFIAPNRNGGADTLSKSLLMIPERFALSMINDDWILRNQIIWHKPNQMPQSATDRFTVDFEKIFFFVKQSTDYYFEQQLEPYTKPLDRWGGDNLKANGKSFWDIGTGQTAYRDRNMRPNIEGKNMRTVWSINTEPFNDAHFATFPEQLVERILKSGCPKDGIVLDPFFGSGTVGVVAKKTHRHYIGIDLNTNYCKMAQKRIENTQQGFDLL